MAWFSDLGNATGDQRVDVAKAERSEPFPPSRLIVHATRPPTVPPRPALWRAAIALWRSRPVLGVGPDNFRRRYEAILSPAPDGKPYTDTRIHANNLYFETLADLGVAGMLALAWMAMALGRLLVAHRAAGGLLGLATGVAAGAFFVHGALDYFLEFTPLFGLFWILLGLAAASALGAPATPAHRDSLP